RFYIEIQDNRLPAQERVNAELVRLARELGLPIVGTNDCHYLQPEDAAAHEVLLCIQTGKTFSDARRWKFETDQLYVKDAAEMAAAFADVPEAITNTLDVARRCDFALTQNRQFPVYEVPAGTTLEEVLERDARRVLDFTFAETDRIAKLYPAPKQGRDFPLEAALAMEPRLQELRNSGEREGRLFDLALRLEGLLRHASKHAAGIVISDRPLTDDVPLWVDKDGAVVTQYTFTDIEAIGLIKFDFLGLKTLTLLDGVARRVREGRGTELHLDRLPLDDRATYKLL